MVELVLALNAGSSNLKCALFEAGGEEPTEVGRTKIDIHGPKADAAAVAELLAWAQALHPSGRLVAVGHRVVHGGASFQEPTLVDEPVLAMLDELSPLAPLHQPQSLATIRAVTTASPDLPQVACFDTAFHRTLPAAATRFGLPRGFHDMGVRRYGFHGLSYEHIAERLRTLDPAMAAGRVIVAHLGSGASLCAMTNGRSIDTTMGFSPLDGLVMNTRCGELDPGVVVYLQDHQGLTIAEVQDLLYRRSGLLGVSGISGDMRELLSSSGANAREAIDLFVFRVARNIGALAASLGGIDGIVFTAGIGENSPAIRALIAERLSWLGLSLDDAANQRGGQGRIGSVGGRLAAWVIPTDEERMIVQQTLATVARGRPGKPRAAQ